VKTGKPKKVTDYHQITSGGLNIYVHHDVNYNKKNLSIGVRKYLFITEVYVYDPETVCLCSGGQKDS